MIIIGNDDHDGGNDVYLVFVYPPPENQCITKQADYSHNPDEGLQEAAINQMVTRWNSNARHAILYVLFLLSQAAYGRIIAPPYEIICLSSIRWPKIAHVFKTRLTARGWPVYKQVWLLLAIVWLLVLVCMYMDTTAKDLVNGVN